MSGFAGFLDGVMSGMERGAELKEYRARSKHNDRVRKYRERMLDEDEAVRDAAKKAAPREAFKQSTHAASRAASEAGTPAEGAFASVPMPKLPDSPATPLRPKPFQTLASAGARPPKKRGWPIKGSFE